MRAQVLLLLVMVCGCEVGGESAVGRDQRALGQLMVTEFVPGPTGSHLGTSLATCPDGLVVASGPGMRVVWQSDGGFRSGPMSGELPLVACDGEVLLAGDGGLHRWTTHWELVAAGAIGAVAARPGRPTLFAGAPRVVLSIDAGVAANLNAVISGPITALAWINDSQFLVGVASEGRVLLVDWPMGGARDLFDGGVPGAGRTFAVGDVWWQEGTEFLVGAQGKVLVFASDAGPIATLVGSHPSFGTAIATASSTLTVDQTWVGEPETRSVWVFTGDAGQQSSFALERFGAALTSHQSTVYIGAPDALDGGGQIARAHSTTPFLDTVVQACSPGGCPSVNCVSGTCIGGVVCTYIGIGFCPDGGLDDDAGTGDAGSGDAGSDDAGSGDAGSGDAGSGDAGSDDAGSDDAGSDDAGSDDAGSDDAGSGDAGSGDAGSGDAGSGDAGSGDAGSGDAGSGDAGPSDAGPLEPVRFATTGCGSCASVDWAPLLAVGLVLLRRRVRPSSRTRS